MRPLPTAPGARGGRRPPPLLSRRSPGALQGGWAALARRRSACGPKRWPHEHSSGCPVGCVSRLFACQTRPVSVPWISGSVNVSGPCCLRYSTKAFPLSRVVMYEHTGSHCIQPAVIFTTVKGRLVCGKPDEQWVQDIVNHQKDKAGSG
ncbi:C-C motif chemokine 13-like [Opisthocomus hoazin]|uniref:C-C motif chemokine 13-like n=1 Tax=Opisthocomus hoazin TaxID=30419 RepID=UPI003F538E77